MLRLSALLARALARPRALPLPAAPLDGLLLVSVGRSVVAACGGRGGGGGPILLTL